jgi:hypothetical protein
MSKNPVMPETILGADPCSVARDRAETGGLPKADLISCSGMPWTVQTTARGVNFERAFGLASLMFCAELPEAERVDLLLGIGDGRPHIVGGLPGNPLQSAGRHVREGAGEA